MSSQARAIPMRKLTMTTIATVRNCPLVPICPGLPTAPMPARS